MSYLQKYTVAKKKYLSIKNGGWINDGSVPPSFDDFNDDDSAVDNNGLVNDDLVPPSFSDYGIDLDDYNDELVPLSNIANWVDEKMPNQVDRKFMYGKNILIREFENKHEVYQDFKVQSNICIANRILTENELANFPIFFGLLYRTVRNVHLLLTVYANFSPDVRQNLKKIDQSIINYLLVDSCSLYLLTIFMNISKLPTDMSAYPNTLEWLLQNAYNISPKLVKFNNKYPEYKLTYASFIDMAFISKPYGSHLPDAVFSDRNILQFVQQNESLVDRPYIHRNNDDSISHNLPNLPTLHSCPKILSFKKM
jgi:hypothetical protein